MSKSLTKLNMIPFAYPWAYQKFLDAIANNWTPQEVQMTLDTAHFRRDMGSNLQHIFRTQLAVLTTSDVQIMDNVLAGITHAIVKTGIMDAPEIRMYLARQGFEEALHTFSYQFILESLGMSPSEQSEFYTLWEREPAIKQRVDYAADVTRSHFDCLEDVGSLIQYLAWYYCIYEGGFFYNGFNPILAITHFTKYVPGSSEQLNYIRRDESMHINFGIDLVNQIRMDYGTPSTFRKFMQMAFSEAVELEKGYASYLMKEPFIGYDAERHVQNFKHLMNIRAKQLGVEEPFPGVICPHSWLSEASDLRKEKNFFETKVTEYKVGSLNWDD